MENNFAVFAPVAEQTASSHHCETCLFRKLSSQFITHEEFEIIERHTIQLKFRKGDTILKQGGITTHLVFLYHGVVKFNYENEFGKNLILTIVASPTMLGGANMFYKDTNLFSIVAVEDCEVCMVEVNTFRHVLINNGKYALMMFEKASDMFKVAVFNFISLAYKQVHGRIADVIIYLAMNIYKSQDFTTPLTRKELAEFAGCSHENVITTLSRWNKEGILEVNGKHIKILNAVKLMEISRLG